MDAVCLGCYCQKLIELNLDRRNIVTTFYVNVYRDQLWFPVFKHSMDQEEGV